MDWEQSLIVTRDQPLALHAVRYWSTSAKQIEENERCRSSEVFKSAILINAAAIILSHNHISGDPTPSQEDIRLTERISHAGEILGIRLLDHVIIAEQRSYSFANAGRLP